MKNLFPNFGATARASLIAAVSGLALLAPGALAQNPAKPKPNILVIIADDLNDWISPMAGHPQAKTPNLDKLAARGVSFANANCAAPICNPSRTAMFSGQRPTTTGVTTTINRG